MAPPPSPRRILVTGASGFVGRHLLPALAERFPDAEVMTARSDLADADSVEAEVRQVLPDGCVHLAAVAAVAAAREDPDQAWRVNLGGTLALARAILLHVPQCLLVFASSADAYGESFRAGTPLDESAPLAPLNPYAATKAAADLALGAMVPEGLRVVRVRAFNHTGPGQAPAFAVPAFARQAARVAAGLQPPVLHVGNLEPRRDFLDVRDVCASYALCLARADALPPGAILNVASGTARRVGDVLDAVLREAGVEARIETSAARLRPADLPIARGDAGLARRVLGWAPSVTWTETLRDVVADWRVRVAAGE
ncbi:MAG: GDP-mannose 4,6-dehydratase [Acetobacteraceae bacterium]|nr:GDP-mannose 4,6-dehydratase [Acetobacteraceae bacterium]